LTQEIVKDHRDKYTARRLADALKRRGVTEKGLKEAMKEIAGGT